MIDNVSTDFHVSQNLTGATWLYEGAGMHVARIYISYEKELRDRSKNGETDHGCTIKEPVGSFSQDGRHGNHHRAHKSV